MVQPEISHTHALVYIRHIALQIKQFDGFQLLFCIRVLVPQHLALTLSTTLLCYTALLAINSTYLDTNYFENTMHCSPTND